MRVLIVGDSHTGALARGLQTLQADGKATRVKVAPIGAGALMSERFFEEREDHVAITVHDKITAVRRLPLKKRFAWYGVSGPLHVQPIVLDPFFYGWGSKAGISSFLGRLTGSRYRRNLALSYGSRPQPVTNSLLERLVMDRKRYSLDFVAALQKLGLAVFVIEGPRTFQHHPAMPKDAARVGLMEARCRAIVRRKLAETGVPVVGIPQMALDQNGLMNTEFRHENSKDKHHANAAFGAIMIDKTLQTLSLEARAADRRKFGLT